MTPVKPNSVRLQVILLLLAGMIILRPLSLFWTLDPDYSYGWGVPFLAAFLFWEEWPRRPLRSVWPRLGPVGSWLLIFSCWAVTLLIVRMVLEANDGWRPMQWMAACLFLSSLVTWLVVYGGWAWARHFAFPLAFFLLSVPWLYSVEKPLTLGLMSFNAQLAATSLVLADIPAQALGNTIQLSTGLLGVDEACSGIRSLQGSLMAALFLGQFYRFRLPLRAALLASALVLALLGNYARLVFLAWQGATQGLSAVHEWHDSAGLFILVFTIAGLWSISLGLDQLASKVPRAAAAPAPVTKESPDRFAPQTRVAFHLAVTFFLVAVGVELFTQAWFAWREATAPRAPGWTVQLPREAPDFTLLPVPETLTESLHQDRALMARWRDARGLEYDLNWFRYFPKANDRVSIDAHNPTYCLPGAGLILDQDEGPLVHQVRGITLTAQVYQFHQGNLPVYVFWITYLNRTNLLLASARPGDRDRDFIGLMQNRFSWFQDAWWGRRGLDAETLEIAITGLPDLAPAQATYLRLLDDLIQPESVPH